MEGESERRKKTQRRGGRETEREEGEERRQRVREGMSVCVRETDHPHTQNATVKPVQPDMKPR